jgi:hypothetical protein
VLCAAIESNMNRLKEGQVKIRYGDMMDNLIRILIAINCHYKYANMWKNKNKQLSSVSDLQLACDKVQNSVAYNYVTSGGCTALQLVTCTKLQIMWCKRGPVTWLLPSTDHS